MHYMYIPNYIDLAESSDSEQELKRSMLHFDVHVCHRPVTQSDVRKTKIKMMYAITIESKTPTETIYICSTGWSFTKLFVSLKSGKHAHIHHVNTHRKVNIIPTILNYVRAYEAYFVLHTEC